MSVSTYRVKKLWARHTDVSKIAYPALMGMLVNGPAKLREHSTVLAVRTKDLKGFHLITRHFQVPPCLKGRPASFRRQSATGLDRLPGDKLDSFVAWTARCPKKSFLPGVAKQTKHFFI